MAAGLDPHQGELYCPTCEQTYARGDRCPTDNTRLVRIATTDAMIGRELDGRYTIVEPIGHGGMGTVYRGTQHSVGREVAIKVVAPNLVANSVVIKRFLREAKLASRLAHPNAVAVLDFGQTDDRMFYLVMELVAGRTLERVVEGGGPLAPARVVRIGAQICDALEGAHALDIVHRDLKPQNVMVMTTGRDLVKVLDFGLAKSLSPDATSATMTNAGALLGTPAYLPPELVSGGACDARADLYALGCVLYFAATGSPPFSAGSIHELIAMHASEPVPPILGWPRRLAAVIEKLLAKEPARRYPTAAAAREALEGALAAELAGPTDEPSFSGTATVLGWSGVPTVPSRPSSARSAPHVRVITPPAGVPQRGSAPRLPGPAPDSGGAPGPASDSGRLPGPAPEGEGAPGPDNWRLPCLVPDSGGAQGPASDSRRMSGLASDSRRVSGPASDNRRTPSHAVGPLPDNGVASSHARGRASDNGARGRAPGAAPTSGPTPSTVPGHPTPIGYAPGSVHVPTPAAGVPPQPRAVPLATPPGRPPVHASASAEGPARPHPPRSRIGLVVVGVLIVLAGAIGAFAIIKARDSSGANPPAQAPAPVPTSR